MNEKTMEKKSVGEMTIERASRYMFEHDGKLSLGLRTDLWLKTRDLDKEVINGNTKLIKNLIWMKSWAKPNSQEDRFLDSLIDRYLGFLPGKLDNEESYMMWFYLGIKGNDEQKKRADEVFDENFNELIAGGSVNWQVDLGFMNYMLERSGRYDLMATKYQREILERVISDNGRFEILTNCFSDLEKKEKRDVTVRKMIGLVAAFELGEKITKDVVNSWATLDWERFDNSEKEFRETFVTNLRVLVELKKSVGNEGILKLYRDYGITHFGRYTAEMLISQLEDEGEDFPYGVALSAYDDWNGALICENSINRRKDLVKSSEALGYRVKFVEARNKATVVRRIRCLAGKFPKQKIAFRYIEGHGKADRIQLGKSGNPEDYLTVDDLKKESARRMKQFYEDNCPTLFDACSTGQKLGPAYAEYDYGYSMAPDKPAQLGEVMLKRDTRGRLFFVGNFISKEPKQVTTVYSFAGSDAGKMVEREESALWEENGYYELIKSREGLGAMWENQTVRLEVLRREKLNPLKKILEGKYGLGKTIIIEYGFEGETNTVGDRLELNLNGKTEEFDWGTKFIEGFGTSCRYIYRKPIAERGKMWPVIRVIKDGENGNKVIVDKFKIDLSDLWPENAKEN